MGSSVTGRISLSCVLGFAFIAGLTLSGCGSTGSGGGWGDQKPSIAGSSSGSASGQPQSKTVVAGQSVTFAVAAAGTGPLTYQWYENGKPIGGATQSSYTISSTTASENGEVFTVAITNAAGTVTSQAATLTVNTPAVIVTQPQNETVAAGQTATFTATATGTAPLSYQWYQNKTAISGANGAAYTTPIAGIANSGSTYSVSVSNVVNTATSNNAVLTVTSLVPSLAFTPVGTKIYGASAFAVNASSASAGSITYSVVSGPATIAGNTVNITGTGTVVLSASQVAAGNYAAATATTSFQVNPAAPTLVFTQPPAPTYIYGASAFPVVASSASNGAVHYTITGPATIAGNMISLTGTGTATVTATQDATADYKASTVSATFQVNPATPTLSFTQAPAATYTYGAAAFPVVASSASNGAVHYTITGPATIAGNMISLTGTGTATVTATQVATADYKTATVSSTFQVNAATPTLSFTSAPSGSIAFNPSAFSISAQSNSTGAITYSVLSGPATVSGNQLQLTGAGTVEIQASVAAAGNYAAANVPRTFTVTAISPNLQLTDPGAPTTFTSTPFTVSTTSNSQGAITYSIVSGPATISATGSVTLTGSGAVVIQASQAANGGYTSATATVTVTTALNVQVGAISPAAETVEPGNITFSDTVTGGVTDAIKWSATGGTINSAGVWTAPNTPGTYTITATSAEDSTKSASVTITVSAPVIQTQPVSQSLCSNGTISLSVAAQYADSYQWYLNNAVITGATNPTYTVAGSSSTAGSYTVVVTNSAGSVTSQPAVVQVGFSITSQPASLTITQGQTAAFSVAATGKGPFGYQWYSVSGGSATAISGATSSTYVTPVQTSAGSSSYLVAVASNSCNAVTDSSTANLTINSGNAPPTITVQPVGQTISANGTATFSVTAVGSGTLSYEWYRVSKGGVNGEITGSAPVAGAVVTTGTGGTTASYTTAAAAKANDQDQYYVVVSNSYGQAVSQKATLAVDQGVQIQIKDQPVNVYVNPGASATFSVTATSTVPLSYQWYMVPPGESAASQKVTVWDTALTSTTTAASAVAIEDATGPTYTVPAAALNQNGAVYYVVVSNGGLTSSVTSNTASLFVGAPSNIPSCSSNWKMQGTNVSYDSTNCAYTLTTSGTYEFGEIIWPSLISTGNLKLSFTIATSGTSSTPADGFAMVLGDPSLGATPTSAGEVGEGLGARGIPGFVLAFDDFYNAPCTGTCNPAPWPADPSSSSNPDYLGVGRGEDALWENPYFNVNNSIPSLAQYNATKQHAYVVNINQGYMSVTMDGVQVFSGQVSVPPVAYLYVTASTGGSFEQTVISKISATVAAPSN